MSFRHALVWAVVLACLPVMGWGQSMGLEAIRKADTASAAVEAYMRAVSNAADPTLAQQAFVTRMIDLESPELAEAQAKEVVQYVNDGQAWAVLAFVDAREDRVEPALEKIIKAAKYSPSNDFVQRTAGQMMAWYELHADLMELPESTRQLAEQVRGGSVSKTRAYSGAHEAATRMLTEGFSDGEPGAMPVNIVGTLEELGTYSGYTTSNTPGLVSYWSSPYLYPGYTLEPWWSDYSYSHPWAFPAVRLRNVSRDVRYIRMPGDQGFLLVDGYGATVVPTSPNYWRTPYYGWQRDPWAVHDGYWNGGYGYGGLPNRRWAPRITYGYGGGYSYAGGNAIYAPRVGYGGYGGWRGYGGSGVFNISPFGSSRIASRIGLPYAGFSPGPSGPVVGRNSGFGNGSGGRGGRGGGGGGGRGGGGGGGRGMR